MDLLCFSSKFEIKMISLGLNTETIRSRSSKDVGSNKVFHIHIYMISL